MKAACEIAASLGLFKCEMESTYLAKQKFTEHVAEYGLSYGTTEEFMYRFNEYMIKDEDLIRINADSTNTFTVGHNQFSTWTDSEYK